MSDQMAPQKKKVNICLSVIQPKQIELLWTEIDDNYYLFQILIFLNECKTQEDNSTENVINSDQEDA